MKVDLVTVTHGTWHRYTPRMIDMVEHYTTTKALGLWVFCDNDSIDAEGLYQREFGLPTLKVFAQDNIGDLPRYNDLFKSLCSSDIIVAVSTDMRLLEHGWIENFIAPFAKDDRIGIVGCPGPGEKMTPAHADGSIGKEWYWVPKLLVDRDIEFDTCEHVQTHAFAVRRQAFLDVGGFWVPESEHLVKGNLIAGEISLSVKLRRAGWKLDYHPPQMHHYGNAAMSPEELDRYDKTRKWSIKWNSA